MPCGLEDRARFFARLDSLRQVRDAPGGWGQSDAAHPGHHTLQPPTHCSHQHTSHQTLAVAAATTTATAVTAATTTAAARGLTALCFITLFLSFPLSLLLAYCAASLQDTPGYFDAPGAGMVPLTCSSALSTPMPTVTVVFCTVDRCRLGKGCTTTAVSAAVAVVAVVAAVAVVAVVAAAAASLSPTPFMHTHTHTVSLSLIYEQIQRHAGRKPQSSRASPVSLL
jgi:hypothetical protein